jgi:heptosyltransferase-2
MAALWPSPAPGTRWIIRLPNWVGDAVMVLPAIRALPAHQQFRVGIAHPRVLDLYAATGLFDQLLPAQGKTAPLALRSTLRSLHPDRCLVFTEAPSGGWLAFLSGAPLRLGRGGAMHRVLFTHRLPPATRQTASWREHMEVAQAAGATPPKTPDFRVPLSENLRTTARRRLPPLALPTLALAPGAAYGPAKRWPLERFVALTERLVGKGYRVIVTGSAQETMLGQALATVGATDLTGQTTLLETIAVLERANLLVTNDSGALHLARAAGTPVVALFGSSSPVWTGPDAQEGDVLKHDVPCSPCFKRECPLTADEHLRCLLGISVDRVAEAVNRRLGVTT